MSNAQDQGFVIEPRSMLSHEWYTDPNTMHLYRHFRLRASYTDTKWRGIELKCGQFVTSLNTLSKETGLSIQQVRTALNKLEATGYITNRSTSKNRIITVLGYYDEQFGNKQINKLITNEQQADNKQVTTINNINNETNNSVGQAPNNYSADIKEIIDYLNSKLGTKYRAQTESTRKHVIARLKEGYSVDDFKRVIDNKYSDWNSDSKMSQYLRPNTLFGSKFEGYLNSKPKQADKTHLSRAEREEMKRKYNANSGFTG